MNGTASCMKCGQLNMHESYCPTENYVHAFQSMSVLCQTQTDTRAKRFKKYLHRACMRQSVNSVPDPTLDHMPYSAALCARSSAGRTLKNKCYDCLPLLVHHLCEVTVPVLSDREIATELSFTRCRISGIGRGVVVAIVRGLAPIRSVICSMSQTSRP